MPKPSGHRDCRVRELLGALTPDEVRHAVERADPKELSPVLRALGVQPRARPDAAAAVLRTRLRALRHEVAHEIAATLCASAGLALAELVEEDAEDVAMELARGPLAAAAAVWPPGLLKLSLEGLWDRGEITADERNALITVLEYPPASTPGPAPSPDPQPAPPPATEAARLLPVEIGPLDRLTGKAVALAVAVPGSPELGAVREALEELLALDPGRTVAWFHYGMVATRLPGGATGPPPQAVRAAFLLGRLHALADRADDTAMTAVVIEEGELVERLLASPEAAPVAAAVLGAQRHDPRAMARLLRRAHGPFPGWARLAASVRSTAAELAARGLLTEAELTIRPVEDALWRWAGAGGEEAPALRREATDLAVQRVGYRRARRDFAGAGSLLGSIDPRFMDGAAHAAAAAEDALVSAEIAGPTAIRFPRTPAERARLVERLGRARPALLAAAEADPGAFLPTLLLGLLLACEDDPAAGPHLTAALDWLAGRPELAELAADVRFHAGLARLRLLEPGTDESAYCDITAALAAGHRPTGEDLVLAAEALEAHGSPHAGEMVRAAAETAGASALVIEMVSARAAAGDAAGCEAAEALAADTGLSLAVRFALLEAALAGAGHHRDLAAAERLAGAIDEVLVRAADTALDERFAAALASNETLRLALDPAHADALRIEVLRRAGRLEDARGVAANLFYRAAGGGLRTFDAGDLHELLAELGAPDDELAELARLVPSSRASEGPAAVDGPVRIVFVGGNESQERYRAAVDAALEERYAGLVEVTWFHPGWKSGWATEAARIEAAYPGAGAIVVMTFVRTHLGRWVRRSAGEHGLPWVACTGHGRLAIQRAIERAVDIAAEASTDRV